MFFPEGQLRVHLYGQPCDMRRSFDGLQGMVRHELGADPLDGSLYCFINRRATQMRVLYFDRSGFCIWAKYISQQCSRSRRFGTLCTRDSSVSSSERTAASLRGSAV